MRVWSNQEISSQSLDSMVLIRLLCTDQDLTPVTQLWLSDSTVNSIWLNPRTDGTGLTTVSRETSGQTGSNGPRTLISMFLTCPWALRHAWSSMRLQLRNSSSIPTDSHTAITISSLDGLILQLITGHHYSHLVSFQYYSLFLKTLFLTPQISLSPRLWTSV